VRGMEPLELEGVRPALESCISDKRVTAMGSTSNKIFWALVVHRFLYRSAEARVSDRAVSRQRKEEEASDLLVLPGLR
jgi:hypothetical protein